MRKRLVATMLYCCCLTFLSAQTLSDCGIPYIDPQDDATSDRDTFFYTTFFETAEPAIHAYYIDINAFGGQQVDQAEVFAILPDSTRKRLSGIAFGNCVDSGQNCVDGFALVLDDSVYVESIRAVEEIDLWLEGFGQPEFSLRNNLQTLSGAGRLSGTLPLCAIGMEVRYDVFNNPTSQSTEFSTQIVCPEVVEQCPLTLSSVINCSENQLQLDAQISDACLPENAQLIWTNESGMEVGEGKSIQLSLTNGSDIFELNIITDCCTLTRPIAVDNPNFLTLEEGQNICVGESFFIAGSGGQDHFWETPDGTTINDSVLVFPVVREESNGAYILHAFNEEGCEETDTFQLTTIVPPTPEFLLPNICIGDTLQLNLINRTSFSSLTWLDPLGQIVVDARIEDIQVDDFGTYQVLAMDSFGCKIETDIPIAGSLPPDVTIDYIESCDSLTAILSPETYSYVWATGDSTRQLSRAENGIVNVTVETEENCAAVLPILFERSDTGRFRVDVRPPICPNDPTGEIEFIPADSDVPMIYSIDGGENFSLSPLFKNLSPATYDILVLDDLGCTDSLQIDIKRSAPLNVQIMSDPITVRPNTSINLRARIRGNVQTFQWLPRSIDSGTNTTAFVATKNTDIRLIVEDDRGCRASDGVALSVVLGDIFIPNAFSPNEDGENDFFTLWSDGNSGEFIERLRIYDRWGSLVFSRDDFEINEADLGWNGQTEGQEAPVGVYIYRAIVRFGNEEKKTYSGSVSLIR
ncbi:MAG: gliding motility-associated C-terminal domain-containing protein [Bacteroidota bacterium]